MHGLCVPALPPKHVLLLTSFTRASPMRSVVLPLPRDVLPIFSLHTPSACTDFDVSCSSRNLLFHSAVTPLSPSLRFIPLNANRFSCFASRRPSRACVDFPSSPRNRFFSSCSRVIFQSEASASSLFTSQPSFLRFTLIPQSDAFVCYVPLSRQTVFDSRLQRFFAGFRRSFVLADLIDLYLSLDFPLNTSANIRLMKFSIFFKRTLETYLMM